MGHRNTTPLSRMRFLLLSSVLALGIITLFGATRSLQLSSYHESKKQPMDNEEKGNSAEHNNQGEDSSRNWCSGQLEGWQDAVHAWMHIPKTAGTTAYRNFIVPLDELSYQVYPSPKSRWNDWNTPGCSPAHGGTHCARSEIEECLTEKLFPEKPVTFHTILRNPVDRVISEFFWWRSQTKAYAWTESMAAKRGNITEWVLDETNLAHNRQSMYFLMDMGYNRDCAAFSANKTWQWIQSNFGSIAALNKHTITHHHLDKFASIIILEEMQKSKQVFSRRVGRDISTVASSINATETKDEHRSSKKVVPQQVKDLILERNQLDMTLYRMAVERLHSC